VGKIRIIGGQFRGRQLEFPDQIQLRPTHDRIRETLFNWLMHDVVGASCLDLFAGSGALGFEALSRGASSAVFVDNDPETLIVLKNNAAKFDGKNTEIISAEFRKSPPKFQDKKFDLVFLDPPYESELILLALNWLQENNLLNKNARIYVEIKKSVIPLIFPLNFQILKEGSTKTISYYLLSQSSRAYSRDLLE
jgi:16S rRNA (guanine966-N2)-methyltransferase